MSDERAEYAKDRNGRNELIGRRDFRLGTPSPDPWDFIAVDANPMFINLLLGSSFTPNPSLVLAPESALRLLPSRALSSAPVARSVSAPAVWCNGGTKKRD